jgi:hypothetical protein
VHVGAQRRLGQHPDTAQLAPLAALAQVIVDVRDARDFRQLFFFLDNRLGS